MFAASEASPWLRLAWSSDDGLPNNTIVGSVQTPDGFLWLGTPNGLARFDGLQFEEFASTNFIALPNRGIVAMAEGHGGSVHLGMDRGAVVTLQGGRAKVFVPDSNVALLIINSITEDAQGALWLAYRDGSVARIENGRMTRWLGENGMPPGYVICSLACDAKGRMWFVKNGRFGLWRNGAFETLRQVPAGAARLAVARDGGIWICAGFHLYKYTEGGELEDHGSFTPRSPGTEPAVMRETRDGAVWIGTTFSGLFRYDGKTFRAVPTTHQEILSFLEDAEGNLWAGTGGGGLNQLRPQALRLITSENGLQFEGVQSLCQDRQGVVWAAMRNGALARLSDGAWQTLPIDDTWAGDAVCVCAEPSGGVWVGTRFHRLLFWRDGRFVPWGDANKIIGQTIHALVVATNGDLWLAEGTPNAVQRVSHGRAESLELPPDLRAIRAAAQDAAGAIWFGTSKGVLLRVDGNRLVDQTAATTGEPQSIRGLCATPDGSLWVAYAGWGVGRLKNGKFAVIAARQGLYDDFVSQIIPDDRGWLWFGANRGVFKVRQQELDEVADGRMSRVRSVHYGPGEYGHGEGRPSLQANFGSAPMALHSRDGRLWLPMRTGLAVVDPSRLRENTKPPMVILTRVRSGENVVGAYGGLVPRPRSPGGKIAELAEAHEALRLPPGRRRLEFEFTALSFVGAENVAFRYRLEGVDEDWVETSQRRAVYPGMPPGDYRFRVIGCNSEGVWNEEGVTMAFEITPFFWQTWWFRGAALALFTGIVIAIVRYVSFRRLRLQLRRLEAQAALHRERGRIAKDIHDDVGASLTQISLLGELARQDGAVSEKVGELITRMSDTARGAVKSLDEIVWAVNPRNDTLAHFVDYTGQYALDYLRLAGVRCRLDLPEHVPARELSTDVRHNLFLVVKEAITNCVRHSHATELRLQINITEQNLSLVVEDNGRGFDPPPENATSDGLRNMRQRLSDVGGQCSIEGRPGTGARVSIELPWSCLRTEA